MDDPDLKIKGIEGISGPKVGGDKNKDKEHKKINSDNNLFNEKSFNRAEENDPDKLAALMQRKLESGLVSSNIPLNKTSSRLNHNLPPPPRSKTKLPIIFTFILCIGGLAYVYADDFFFESKRMEERDNQASNLRKQKISVAKDLTSLSCDAIFSGRENYQLKFIASNEKSLLKSLDCMLLVGDRKAFEDVLVANEKISKSKTVDLYRSLAKYLRFWDLNKPPRTGCVKWELRSSCVNKLFWYFSQNNRALYLKYLNKIRISKKATQFEKSILNLLQGMGNSLRGKNKLASKQLLLSFRVLPDEMRGLKSVVGLVYFNFLVKLKLDHRPAAKMIRDVQSIGSNEFRDLQGIMTRLALAKSSAEIVKAIKLKKQVVFKFPSIMHFWLQNAAFTGDYSELDESIISSLSFVYRTMRGVEKIKSQILLLKARSFIGQKKFKEASRVLDVAKNNPEANFMKSIVSFDINNQSTWEEAQENLGKVSNKQMLKSWQFLAFGSFLYGVSGKTKKASYLFSNMKKRFPKFGRSYWGKVSQAAMALGKGDFLTGNSILKKLVNEEKFQHPVPLGMLVYSYNLLNNLAEAQKFQRKLGILETKIDYYKSKSYLYSPFGCLVFLDNKFELGPI